MGDVSYFATLMVNAGDADGMVSGRRPHHRRHDPAGVPGHQGPARRLRGLERLPHVLADRVLVYGDCAVNPKPDSEQLADIAISSAETAATFGVEPRIAMLSYSTGESARARTWTPCAPRPTWCASAGPTSRWRARSSTTPPWTPAVAEKKLPGSEVAGQATVFIFPDLDTGNIAYKAVQRSSGAAAVGPVLQGLRKPVNDLSRGCTVTDIVNTVVVTAIQAQEIAGRSTSRVRESAAGDMRLKKRR